MSGSQRLFYVFVRVAATVALLTAIVWTVQPHKLVVVLSKIRPTGVAAAVALLVPFLFMKALKWRMAARAFGLAITLSEAVRSFMAGLGVSVVTPLRIGEVSRLYVASRDRLPHAASALVLDKMFDLATIFALSMFGAAVFWGRAGWIFGSAVVFASVAALPFAYRALTGLIRRADQFGFRLAGVDDLNTLDTSTVQRSRLLLLGVLSMAAYVLAIFQFYFLLAAFRRTTILAAFFSLPLMTLTNLFPITIGNVGVREAVAIAATRAFGVSSQDAFCASILLFLIDMVLPGIVGVILMGLGRRRISPRR